MNSIILKIMLVFEVRLILPPIAIVVLGWRPLISINYLGPLLNSSYHMQEMLDFHFSTALETNL